MIEALSREIFFRRWSRTYLFRPSVAWSKFRLKIKSPVGDVEEDDAAAVGDTGVVVCDSDFLMIFF
jgi:hypothetical protein